MSHQDVRGARVGCKSDVGSVHGEHFVVNSWVRVGVVVKVGVGVVVGVGVEVDSRIGVIKGVGS